MRKASTNGICNDFIGLGGFFVFRTTPMGGGLSLSIYMYIYMYVNISLYTPIYIYIYIYKIDSPIMYIYII